jgi:hypothetical protein
MVGQAYREPLAERLGNSKLALARVSADARDAVCRQGRLQGSSAQDHLL